MENSYTPPPQIPNHLLLGVLTTIFCCLPFGIISIVYAVQVNTAMVSQNYAVARVASEKARYWGMLALWIGIAINILCLFSYVLGLIGASTLG